MTGFYPWSDSMIPMMLVGQSKDYQDFKGKLDQMLGPSDKRDSMSLFLQMKARQMEQEAIQAADRESEEAMKAFLERNELDPDVFKYVSDSGLTPIYTFDRFQINFDFLVPPKGYILQRNTLDDGSYTYQLVQKDNKLGYNTVYKFFIFFINEKDWDLDD